MRCCNEEPSVSGVINGDCSSPRSPWNCETIDKGLHELRQGIRCVENFAARGRPRWEDHNAQLAGDIRALVEPRTQADPELKSSRRYSNWSAAEVLKALQTQKGY